MRVLLSALRTSCGRAPGPMQTSTPWRLRELPHRPAKGRRTVSSLTTHRGHSGLGRLSDHVGRTAGELKRHDEGRDCTIAAPLTPAPRCSSMKTPARHQTEPHAHGVEPPGWSDTGDPRPQILAEERPIADASAATPGLISTAREASAVATAGARSVLPTSNVRGSRGHPEEFVPTRAFASDAPTSDRQDVLEPQLWRLPGLRARAATARIKEAH